MIRHKIKYVLLSLCLLSFFSACDKSEPDPGPEPPAPGSPAPRTVLVYMIADNNLYLNASRNLEQMLAGASARNLNNGNLVVYVDSKRETPQLLQIKAKADGTIIKESVVDYEEQNSADPEIMKGIIEDVIARFPAESYGLICWSHGTAWMPQNAGNMTRSFGDDDGNMLELDQLKEAIPNPEGDKKFDFILFDACYMGSTEVAFALKDKADYFIGSPNEILSYGFPYDRIVKRMFTATADLRGICEDFYNWYNEGNNKYATISLTATKEMDALAANLREITRNHRDEIQSLPLSQIQALDYLYSKRVLYDLEDYVKNLATPEEYARFQSILSNTVLYKVCTDYSYYANKGTVKNDASRFSGLTIYIMDQFPLLDDWYKQLDWYKAVYED